MSEIWLLNHSIYIFFRGFYRLRGGRYELVSLVAFVAIDTWVGNAVFEQIYACRIVFIYQVFIPVIQVCESFMWIRGGGNRGLVNTRKNIIDDGCYYWSSNCLSVRNARVYHWLLLGFVVLDRQFYVCILQIYVCLLCLFFFRHFLVCPYSIYGF